MSFWSPFQPADCLPDHCNCEYISDSFIRQPLCSWTSLAYVLLALWLYRGAREKTFELKLWTAAFLILGCVSFFAHASFIQLAMAFDFAGIILVISFFALINLLELLKQSPRRMVWYLSFYFIAVASAMYFMSKLAKIGIALLVFVFAIGDLLRDMGWSFLKERTLQLSLLVLGASFTLFVLDELHWKCDPHSLLQLHSIWHIGTAFSIYLYGKWRFKDLL